ncbi:MAG: HIT family protein [Desulfurococcales archaeon]|nr:HIT family protein [Desulfurococcales archaeon]
MEHCVFCRIVRGEIPAYTVYKDDDVTVFLDIYPVDKGHLLVVSNTHYESAEEAPPETAAKVFAVATAFARIYRVRLGAPGVNILTNSGRHAGQEIFHFHVHVIPRWRGGGWRALLARHRLTEDEAREVLGLLEQHLDIVKEYASRV